MNYQEFDKYIREMSQEIFDECEGDMDRAHDLSFERANDSEYAIYYTKAWDLCDFMRFNDHDAYLETENLIEELGGFGNYKSVDDIKCTMASAIILDALREALDTLAHQEGVTA
jgi:hypothetical protein|tara:strand:+ start:505 stop:846 length:342 start_codon:yes stop_codon:yes gene_type:complete